MQQSLQYNVVYILDVGAYSGGGEALYQLGCDLIDFGYIVHVIQLDSTVNPPTKFVKYIQHGLHLSSMKIIEDSFTNLLIVPETATSFLFKYKNIKKMIWWLSFNYTDQRLFWNTADSFSNLLLHGNRNRVKSKLATISNYFHYGRLHYSLDNAINVAGSFYAEECLKEYYNIHSYRLFHSIGKDFLNAGMINELTKRTDLVLYNPSKPSKLQRALVKRAKFHYVPIAGLNFDNMIQLFRSAKLYVDFGAFPGPERLPKETVFNGVNILVANRNAAKTNDVLIPEKYKIKAESTVIETEVIIGTMLKNYYIDFPDFHPFRKMILGLEDDYYKQLSKLFLTNDSEIL